MKRIHKSGLSLRMAFAVLLSASFFTCRIGVDEPVNNGGGNNSPPVLQQPNDTVIGVGQTLRITLSASDPNGDALTYSMRNAPSGASLSGSIFTWTPAVNQAAAYLVDFIATERTADSLRDTATVRITVQDTASTAGLVAYWDFNEGAGTTLTDRSGNGNHGVINGATWAIGIEGAALNLNGISNGILVSNSPTISNNNNFTIGIWVYITNFSRQIIFLNSDGGTAQDVGFALRIDQNNLTFQIGDGVTASTLRSSADTNLFLNKWTYIVSTYDGMSMKMYMNDSLFNTLVISKSIKPTSADYAMGYFPNFGQYFRGNLDQCRIYNRALTVTEIAAEWGRYKDRIPSTTGIVAYWPFSGNANDASGNGNNGTVNGATLTADRFGYANSAYSFDGLNDWIETPHNSSFDFISSSQFSLSCWVNASGTGGTWYVKGERGVDYNWGLRDRGNGDLTFRTSPGDPVIGNTPVVTDNANNWTHYVVIQTNNQILCYVNGNLFQTNNLTVNNGDVNSRPLYLGTEDKVGGFARFEFDDFRVYNRALTLSEIQVLFNEGR